MDSDFPILDRTANEDGIDFLLRSINKINSPEALNTDWVTVTSMFTKGKGKRNT